MKEPLDLEALVAHERERVREIIEDEGKTYAATLWLFGFPLPDSLTPLFFADGIDAVSRRLARNAAVLAAATGADAVVFSSEVWMALARHDDPERKKKIDQMARARLLGTLPERRECVMIGAATPTGTLTRIWEIVRDDRGRRRLSTDGPNPTKIRDNFFVDDLPWKT